jgi:hypothetical protein
LPLDQAFVTLDGGLHDLKGFDCGKPSMNEFIARYAAKHSLLGLSRTYVLSEVSSAPKKPIVAYLTLASSTLVREVIPEKKSLPAYPIPVVILARLAISTHY